MDPQMAKLLPIVIPLLLVAWVLRRNLRPRPLQIERMWLYPVILIVLLGTDLFESPPTTMTAIAALVAGFGLGAVAGWYRGRLTQITIDPETHAMTSQSSIWGVALIGGLFVVRFGLRDYLMQGGMADAGAAHAKLGATATLITDALLTFSVGMMGVSRLEIWMRASKMLAEAQAAKTR
jgi:hypothetical protein